MNKMEKIEYIFNKRQSTRRRNDKMLENIVHDNLYTFADEYYEELRNDYFSDLLKEKEEE